MFALDRLDGQGRAKRLIAAVVLTLAKFGLAKCPLQIREKVREDLNGYIPSPVLKGTMNRYIVPPGLGKRSGILGAMAMAKNSSL